MQQEPLSRRKWIQPVPRLELLRFGCFSRLISQAARTCAVTELGPTKLVFCGFLFRKGSPLGCWAWSKNPHSQSVSLPTQCDNLTSLTPKLEDPWSSTRLSSFVQNLGDKLQPVAITHRHSTGCRGGGNNPAKLPGRKNALELRNIPGFGCLPSQQWDF